MELKEKQLHDHSGAPPPDIEGEGGKAWRCNVHEGPDNSALVGWLIYCPKAHPFWSWYMLSAIHLRETDPPAKESLIIHNELATHELLLMAADAANTNVIRSMVNGDHEYKLEILEPANFAAQFTEITDDLAIERIEKTVREICDGQLSPDTDYLSMWIERYGDSMVKK